MADSLREQLLQAGFKQPETEPARKKQTLADNPSRKARHATKSPGNSSTQRSDQARVKTRHGESKKQAQNAATEQRKIIKAQIRTLIEAAAIKEFAGEIAYRYTLQNRIRELHVTEAIRQQLVAGTLVVTRLNGTTYLVPDSTAVDILALNPNWVIVKPGEISPDATEGYDDFPVPDDLIW